MTGGTTQMGSCCHYSQFLSLVELAKCEVGCSLLFVTKRSSSENSQAGSNETLQKELVLRHFCSSSTSGRSFSIGCRRQPEEQVGKPGGESRNHHRPRNVHSECTAGKACQATHRTFQPGAQFQQVGNSHSTHHLLPRTGCSAFW